MYKQTIKALALAVGLSIGGVVVAGPGQSAMNEEPAVWHVTAPSPYYHPRSEVRADFRAALRECRSLYGEARRQCHVDARTVRDESLAVIQGSRYVYIDPVPQSVPQYMLYGPFEGPAVP